MATNMTILRPPAPKYAINETVYAIISAKKGFIEPLFVYQIDFDPARNMYLYTFRTSLSGELQLVPARLYEDQITDICDALSTQIRVLEREYEKAVELFEGRCPSGVPAYQQQITYENYKMQVKPPRPRFGYNEVVYLRETAESVGRLEAARISEVVWNSDANQWNYIIEIHPRPEHHMTVGDANNRRQIYKVAYAEKELAPFCEAQDVVINFLSTALNGARRRLAALCQGSGT